MDEIGILSSAFKDQKTITSVKFGSQCTFVGEEAFSGCISLSEINDDNVIEEIYAGAFASTKLSSAKFDKLSSIGNGAFKECSNLTYVSISNCTEVPNEAFYNCSSLTSININKCEHIGDSAFYKCSKLCDFNFENCIAIGTNAFSECTSLEKANLNNCDGIGSSAFYRCVGLKEIKLSNSKGIGSYAFSECTNLDKIYINASSIIPLGSNVFSNCSNIKIYLGTDMYDQYISDNAWREYASYMIKMAGVNEIIYTSSNNEIINISEEAYSGSTKNNNYNNDHGIITIGGIEDQITITSFDQKIFKGNRELVSINLPSKCSEIGNNEFEGCEKLDTFTPSHSTDLTKIGEYAFKDCKSLISFEIPNSLTTIGEGAFAGCSSIKEFYGDSYVYYNGKAVVKDGTLICVLPKDDNDTEGRYYNISDIDSTITKLGKSCFYGCEELRRVDISSNIEEIGDNAFEGCKNLREVHMGSDVPKIGSNVFGSELHKDFKILVPENNYVAYCLKWKNSGYEQYIYPKPNNNSIIYYSAEKLISDSEEKSYSNYTNGNYYKISNIKNVLSSNYFSEKSVKKVIIGENITELNNSAFKKCTDLEYIHIPDSITKIGDECFYCCESIESINIPNKYSHTYTIEFDTNGSESEKVKFSKGQTVFGNEIFYGCKNLKEFSSYYSRFVSSDGRCYIDDGELNFFAYGDIKSYNIPNEVIKINRSAFRGSDIANITLNERIKNIGEYAFAECKSLSSIENWDNVETISEGAFMNCYDSINKNGLGDITLPNMLLEIGKEAFINCSNLSTITLSNNLTHIGNGAFKGCKNLSCITLPNSLTYIGSRAFQECFVDSEDINIAISLPNNVEVIGNYCFASSNIKEFIINNGSKLKKLPTCSFYNCEKLKRVDISKSTTISTIEDSTIEDYELSTIEDYAFFNCTSLTDVQLADTITYINDYAFAECKKISSITLPSSLLKLGNNCLTTATETNIKIPSSLITPPVFTYNGRESNKSYPFGDPSESDANTPNIVVPTIELSLIYKNNKYWKIYKHNIKLNMNESPKVDV